MKLSHENFEVITDTNGIMVKTDKFNISVSPYGFVLYEKGEIILDGSSLFGRLKAVEIPKKNFKCFEENHLLVLERRGTKGREAKK